jgi:hypothetical protein
LRNRHEHLVGIVQFTKGRRGAPRNKYRLPGEPFTAAQQAPPGTTETAR